MNAVLRKTGEFLEMIKFEHSIFALPFAYLGLFLGEGGWPRLNLFLWVTLAMVSFRTMAMGLNRLLDAAIDAKNPRTQNRAIPAGRLKKHFVWICAVISFFVFEASAYKLGNFCFQLTPIPVFLAWVYPLLKRFTWFCHFVLGIILGIAPYGAWLASGQGFSWIPGFLTLGIITWVAGFDMIYALQDAEIDRREGLQSLPARFGQAKTVITTRVLHVFTLAAWAAAGKLAGLGVFYAAGLAAAAFFLIRQHWLVRSYGVQKLNEAFFTMNAVVSVTVFAAVVFDLSFHKGL